MATSTCCSLNTCPGELQYLWEMKRVYRYHLLYDDKYIKPLFLRALASLLCKIIKEADLGQATSILQGIWGMAASLVFLTIHFLDRVKIKDVGHPQTLLGSYIKDMSSRMFHV